MNGKHETPDKFEVVARALRGSVLTDINQHYLNKVLKESEGQEFIELNGEKIDRKLFLDAWNELCVHVAGDRPQPRVIIEQGEAVIVEPEMGWGTKIAIGASLALAFLSLGYSLYINKDLTFHVGRVR